MAGLEGVSHFWLSRTRVHKTGISALYRLQ